MLRKNYSYLTGYILHILQIRARFLSLARSKLRLCSANHRAGYWSNLPCDWLSIVWVGSLCKISDALQLNLHMHPSKFRQECQDIVRSKFIQEWAADIADTSKHPILRTYRYIKSSFRTEPYLYLVNDQRYRRAISQLRCSSHILNVEKGRYTRPRTPLDERLCNMCNCVDDELHFITACAVNVNERRALYDKLTDKFPEFEHLCDLEKFVFLFTFDDAQMLSWLGKFLYKSFRSKSVQTECL